MQKIWESLSKPDELKDRKLSDYFDLSFAALPHKVLEAQKFESEVLELRKRFVEKSREDYVFKPAYHKRIPADGVAFYMEGIWVCCCHLLCCLELGVADILALVGTSPEQQGPGPSHTTGTACPVPLRRDLRRRTHRV